MTLKGKYCISNNSIGGLYTDLGEQLTIFNFPVIPKKLISNGEKAINLYISHLIIEYHEKNFRYSLFVRFDQAEKSSHATVPLRAQQFLFCFTISDY